jgi:hypothetical protein
MARAMVGVYRCKRAWALAGRVVEEERCFWKMEGERYTVLVKLDALATQPPVMAAATEALPSSQRTERRYVRLAVEKGRPQGRLWRR